jgi:hypothetical protein
LIHSTSYPLKHIHPSLSKGGNATGRQSLSTEKISLADTIQIRGFQISIQGIQPERSVNPKWAPTLIAGNQGKDCLGHVGHKLRKNLPATALFSLGQIQ